MRECANCAKRSYCRNDAEENIANDGEVRSGDEIRIPFVVAADHDESTLRNAV